MAADPVSDTDTLSEGERMYKHIKKALNEGKFKVNETIIARQGQLGRWNEIPIGPRWYPLVYAVYTNNIKLVRLLIKHGADLEIQDGLAFGIAIKRELHEIIELFIDNGADINEIYCSDYDLHTIPLERFISKYIEAKNSIKEYSEMNTNINADTSPDDRLAAAIRNVEFKKDFYYRMIQKVLNRDDVDQLDMAEAVCYPTEMCDYEVIKMLLDNGLNPNILVSDTNISPPTYLGTSERPEDEIIAMIRLYMEYGYDIDCRTTKENPELPNTTLLHSLLDGRCMIAAEWLINKGVDVFVPSKFFPTALFACKWTSSRLTEILLKKGCDPNVVEERGNISLQPAKLNLVQLYENNNSILTERTDRIEFIEDQCNDVLRTVQLYVEHGLNVNHKNKYSTTLLYNVLRASRYCRDTVLYLLENGAKVNNIVKHSNGLDHINIFEMFVIGYPYKDRTIINRDIGHGELHGDEFAVDKLKLLIHFGAQFDRYKLIESFYEVSRDYHPDSDYFRNLMKMADLIKGLPPVKSLLRMCMDVLYYDIDDLIAQGHPPLLFIWPEDLGLDLSFDYKAHYKYIHDHIHDIIAGEDDY